MEDWNSPFSSSSTSSSYYYLLDWNSALWTLLTLLFLYLFWKYLTNSLSFQFNWNESSDELNFSSNSASSFSSEILNPVYNLQIFVGTWNLGGRTSPSSLKKWINSSGIKYDIYVIGVQECSYIVHPDKDCDPSCTERTFSNLLSNCLNENQNFLDYEKIATVSRGSHRLYVLLKRKFLNRISDIQTCVFPHFGDGHSNGIVGTSFRIHESTFCFLNGHFLPDNSESDLINILNQIRMGDITQPIFGGQFQYIFLFGSFSLPIHLSQDSIRHNVLSKDWTSIQNCDGMELLKKNFEALQIFREKPMEVSPIFKAREVYWTDRIWFASFPNCKLQQDLFQEVTMKNSFYIPSYVNTAKYSVFTCEILTSPSAISFRRTEIVFSQLTITGLYPNGESLLNPFISFYIPVAEKTRSPCTIVKKGIKSDTVTWTAKQIPSIKLNLTHESVLKYVLFGIFSYHQTEQNKFCGYAIISLKEVLNVSPQPFSCSVFYEGKKLPHTQLSGYFHLHSKEPIMNIKTNDCKCHLETFPFQNLPQEQKLQNN